MPLLKKRKRLKQDVYGTERVHGLQENTCQLYIFQLGESSLDDL